MPAAGTVLITVRAEDRDEAMKVAVRLSGAGMRLIGTSGTARFLESEGIPCAVVNKAYEGSPHTVDAIRGGDVDLVINTSSSPQSVRDSFTLRRAALEVGVPYFTTIAGAVAAAEGMTMVDRSRPRVTALQDFHAGNWS